MDEPQTGQPDVPPSKVYVELTTDCNLDCAMCIRHVWDEPSGRMSRGVFQQVIDQLADLPSVSTIQLGGFGEPMMHADFFSFVALAKERGYAVECITNGVLLDAAAADQVISSGLDRLVVSMDSVEPTGSTLLHTASPATVRSNIQRLYAQRLQRKSATPDIAVEFVATRRNIAELPALRRLSRALGITQIIVTNPIPYTQDLADQLLYEHLATTPRRRPVSVYSPVVDLPYMDASPEADSVRRQLIQSGAHVQVNGVPVTSRGPRCRFITEGRFAIAWNGDVAPCLALLHSHAYHFRGDRREIIAYPVGNVEDRPLAHIWQDGAYRAFRARVLAWDFSPCIDCGGCELREANDQDCFGSDFPRCGECLWAAGIVQCP